MRAEIPNASDGIIDIIVNNPPSQDGTSFTNARDHLLVRKGSARNPMIFPSADYDNDAFGLDSGSGKYTFTHQALGADMFRFLWNYGQNWTTWTAYEDVTSIDKSLFDNDENWWAGEHIIVQCKCSYSYTSMCCDLLINFAIGWSAIAASSYTVVHADRNYAHQCRVPQFLARGPFNTWGFHRGVSFQMDNTADGRWELEIMSTWPTYLQLNVFGFDDYFYGDTDGNGVMTASRPTWLRPTT